MSIRKGCRYCGAPLNTFKEKAFRVCKVCAEENREAFAMMGQGKFKEGKEKLLERMAVEKVQKASQAIDITMKNALSKKEKKIRKKLRARGLTEAEIEGGLAELNKGLKENE